MIDENFERDEERIMGQCTEILYAPLTPSEQSMFAVCEEVIAKGLQQFLAVGGALMRIRNERLYRTRFETFEEYCEKRWDITRQRAHQLIKGAEAYRHIKEPKPVAIEYTDTVEGEDGVEEMSTTVDIQPQDPPSILPTNERQLRPLVSLPPSKQGEAWNLATKRCGGLQPSFKDVEKAVAEIKQASNPTPEISEEDALASQANEIWETFMNGYRDMFYFFKESGATSYLSRDMDDDRLENLADFLSTASRFFEEFRSRVMEAKP